MNRQQKINFIKAVQAGVPVSLIMEISGVPFIVLRKMDDGTLYFNDGRVLTDEEIQYLEKMDGISTPFSLPIVVFPMFFK